MWNWRGFLPALLPPLDLFKTWFIFSVAPLLIPLLFSKLHSVSAEFMFRLLKKRLCKELWPLSSLSQSLSSSLSSSLSQSFKRPLWLSLNSWQSHSFNNMLSSDNQWWCTTQQCEKLNISRVSWSLVHSYHFRAAPFSLSSVTAFKHFSSSFLRAFKLLTDGFAADIFLWVSASELTEQNHMMSEY